MQKLSNCLSYFGLTKINEMTVKCIFGLLMAEMLDLMQIIKSRLK